MRTTGETRGRRRETGVASCLLKFHDGRMSNNNAVLLTCLLAALVPYTHAQTETCVPITTSTECSAFVPFSISTDSYLVGLYPFLRNVKNATTFDTQLSRYVNTTYVQLKYETLFGCGNILLSNTTNLYARYTTSVICNGIIQNSKEPCNLTAADSRPVCANTCAEQALSESVITSNSELCSNPSNYTDTQIRADFTNCALPAESLQNADCVQGSANEINNCGFGGSTLGMCTYCSQNSDDTCCTASQAGSKCANVVIPSSISSISLPTAISSAVSSSTSGQAATTSSPSSSLSGASAARAGSRSSNGISGTTIAVIVVGCIVGVALFASLIFILCFCMRKRRKRENDTSLLAVHDKKVAADSDSAISSGPPSPTFQQKGPISNYTVLPGGRIARKSTLAEPPPVSKPASTKRGRLTKQPPEQVQEEYTVLPGGRMARTTAMNTSTTDQVSISSGQWQQSKLLTSGYPQEVVSQQGNNSNITPCQPQPKSAENFPPVQASGTRYNTSSGEAKLFLYPLALLEGNSGTYPASSKDDSTPSLSAADMKDYELLPGGHLARKYVPKLIGRSPVSSTVSSKRPSRESSRASSPQRPSPPESPSSDPEAYHQLPGGRMVRKAALDNHIHNSGLKSSFQALMSGALGVGAAAVASAAKLRQSDEESRRSVKRAPTPHPRLPSSDTERKLSSDAVAAKDNSNEAVSPGPSPTSSSPLEEEKQEPSIDLDKLSPPPAPAVPSFRDTYSDSIFTAGDVVAVVWSYQPQTQDEFALERGDMIEIISIWNDGWATGRFSSDRIDAWEQKHGILIDMDLIELDPGSELRKVPTSVVKAFPLVCVCSPRYWRKAVRES
ncbi:hypothetical protein V8E51_017751 [Hyaloscypha variabilis]